MIDDHSNPSPEKDTRWKRGGPSPNPYGRKGKPRNRDNAATAALDQPVSVRLNGKTTKKTVRDASALKLGQEATSGDPKALKTLLDWERYERSQAAGVGSASYPLNEDDLRTIDAICLRIRLTPPREGSQ